MDRVSGIKKTNKNKADQRVIISGVEYAGDYFLYVTLSDNTARMINLKPLLESATMYKPFLDKKVFQKYTFTPNMIIWPGNILDRHIKHII